MRIRKKFISYIYLALIFMFVIFGVILFTDPKARIIPALPITYKYLFVLLFFLCIGSFFTFLVKRLREGILISTFFTGIVILKLIDFFKFPYVLLLLVVVVGSEIYFRSKRAVET